MSGSVHEDIKLGILARDRGATERAIGHFCDALTTDPENGIAHAHLSITLSMSGQPLAALEEAKRALRAQPNAPASHLAMAMASLLIDDPATARDSVEETLRLDPHSVGALQMRAGEAVLARDMDALEAAATAIRSAEPFNAEAPALLADVAYARGDAPKAEAEARNALSLAPNGAMSHVAIGKAFLLQGRYEDARDAGLSALAIDPTSNGARRLLTDVRFGRLPIVGRVFTMIVRLNELSFRRALPVLGIGLSVLLVAIAVARHYDIDWLRSIFSYAAILIGGSVLGVTIIHGRAMAEFQKNARLKRDY